MKSIAPSLLPLLLVVLFAVCDAMGNKIDDQRAKVFSVLRTIDAEWPADEFIMGRDLEGPIDWTEPKLFGSNKTLKGNVNCGGGYCPSAAPICCGGPRLYFCVPGGMSCCAAAGGTYSDACAMGSVCCASQSNTTCCKSDEVCARGTDGQSFCEKDVCSKYHTADECFEGANNCSWCCSDRRCVSKPTQCKSASTVISQGEKCASRCQYADTCNLCLRYNNDTNTSEDLCEWCCSSQSCIPAQKAQQCENNQVVNDTKVCSACQANGSGLNPHYVVTVAQMIAILAGIVLFFDILACFGVVRCFLYMRANTMLHSGMRVVEAEAHLSVQRHGFNTAAEVPRFSRPFAALRKWGSAVIAAFFVSKKIQSEEEDDGGPAMKGVLQCRGCYSVLKLKTLAAVVNLTKGGKRMSGDEAIKHSEGVSGVNNSNRDNNKDDDDDSDDDVVILLPCCHLFCYPCVGLGATGSLEAESRCAVPSPDGIDNARESFVSLHVLDAGPQPSLPEQQPQQEEHAQEQNEEREEKRIKPAAADPCAPNPGNPLSPSPPRRRSHFWRGDFFGLLRRHKKPRTGVASANKEEREKVLLKHIQKKCPACKKPVKDVLFSENILKL